MLKKILLLSFALCTLNAQEMNGYEIYKKRCSQCHVEMMSKDEALKNLDRLKAPPMVEVSNRLKSHISIADNDEDVKRRVIIAFIKDYIDNPDIQYSMCHMGALERFDVMPSQKGILNDDEKESVAAWVYDRYEGVKF